MHKGSLAIFEMHFLWQVNAAVASPIGLFSTKLVN